MQIFVIRGTWRYQGSWVIRDSKSKQDRQYNVQNKKDKRTNNDLQNNTQKTTEEQTIQWPKQKGKDDFDLNVLFLEDNKTVSGIENAITNRKQK
jgi:hypothetical protein